MFTLNDLSGLFLFNENQNISAKFYKENAAKTSGLLFWLDKQKHLWCRAVVWVQLSCQAAAPLISACACGSANVKGSSSLCSSSSVTCRLTLPSPSLLTSRSQPSDSPSGTTSAPRRSVVRTEDAQQYLTAVSGKCHNNRPAQASQCPYACMVPGLNVCAWGARWTLSWVYECGLFHR